MQAIRLDILMFFRYFNLKCMQETTKYKIATTYDEYVGCHSLLKKDDELQVILL